MLIFFYANLNEKSKRETETEEPFFFIRATKMKKTTCWLEILDAPDNAYTCNMRISARFQVPRPLF